MKLAYLITVEVFDEIIFEVLSFESSTNSDGVGAFVAFLNIVLFKNYFAFIIFPDCTRFY